MTTRRITFGLCVSVALFACVISTRASGAVAVFAIVQRVVFEPNETNPERIQVWGVFSVSDGYQGLGYLPPERGYLYFSLPALAETQLRQGAYSSSRQIALNEWKDLKTVAGTELGVAFGERGDFKPRVRPASETPTRPEAYPRYNGLTQFLGRDGTGPEVILKLKAALKGK